MRFHKGRDVLECVSRVMGRAILPFGNRRSATAVRRATLNSELFTLNSSGFTLIELLIVTVVIVTLMGILFRLAGVGADPSARSKTQARLQRLENAISGYYAAYGSYPPVPLQGRSRDINAKIDKYGVQGTEIQNVGLSKEWNATDSESYRTRSQIEAACRAQPIAVLYPFFMYERGGGKVYGEQKRKHEDLVTFLREKGTESGGGGGNFSYIQNVGGLNLGEKDEATIFQFGLLSFLLPRYQFMLEGASEMYDTRNSQWANNNQLPSRIDTGRPYENWEAIQKILYGADEDGPNGCEAFLVRNLASQVVCSRWMPNFEGIISGGREFYGVKTWEPDEQKTYLMGEIYKWGGADKELRGKRVRLFSPGGYNNASSMYLLNGMTVLDGWDREFYYYSEAPYQSYRLWSAGSNGYTFPPWLMMNLNKYSAKEQETITKWTKDDISHLAN